MSTELKSFVFVHGAWHNRSTWDLVTPFLVASGHEVRVVDLPGAGVNAKSPVAYSRRPLDAAAFGTEPSPNADVTQDERSRVIIQIIEELKASHDRPIVLVGHSLGGLTITDVAERIPDQLDALVYVTAFLLQPQMPAIAMIQHETMSTALVPSLFMADPASTGALRIDPMSEDSDYRERLFQAFYGDVDKVVAAKVIAGLQCDEPVGVALQPSLASAPNFGSVSRHFIRCLKDRAIPLAGQDKMIADIDSVFGAKTISHTLDASHSPFFSMPKELAELLMTV